MRCSDVRELLYAFLDNELDAPLSIELQGHLERCPHCARDAEVERVIRQRLEHALAADIPDIPFEPRRFSRAPAARRTVPPRRRYLALACGLAVIVVLLAGVWWTMRPGDGGDFVRLVASESAPFLEQRGPLHIASNDRAAVTDWLRDNTNLHLTLPPAADSSWLLIGARRCSLGGRPAAFALYELDGMTATLVVISGDEQQVAGMEPARHEGRVFGLSRCGGRNVVAFQRDGLVYSAVSSVPRTRLFELLGSVEP